MFLKERPPSIDHEAVISALANDHDRQILALAQDEPVEAPTILEHTGIPKSTLYRRISRLREQGLLCVSGSKIRDGHRIDLYRCPLEEVSLTVRDGSVQVDWTRADQGLDHPEPSPPQ